jgi:Na+/proline symporter
MSWEWLALALYAVALYAVAPPARTHRGFFWAEDAAHEAPSLALLTGSVLVSWIFAKSITNAANLGEKYGLIGGLAYAGWYFSVPVAGILIYRIRRSGHEGLIPFLVERFGPGSAFLFSAAILIRLFNEVWSNTAVVGAYFGPPGSASYYFAAFAFTGSVLLYTLRGGLRSSVFTDRLQLLLAVVLLGWVLAWVVPSHSLEELTSGCLFTLTGGLDLLLVALLQTTSYPFHDPVLTDRAFITSRGRMLAAYTLAGLLGVVFICLYSLIGIYARLEGLSGAGDAPVRVAAALQTSALWVVSLLMMNSAGACLDSAFSAISRHVAVDLAGEGGAHPSAFPGLLTPLRRLAESDRGLRLGRVTMLAFALLGNLPLFFGTNILQATTISGTMVLGLAPPFVFGLWHRRAPVAFYLSFACGLLVGVLVAANAWPSSLDIGTGANRALLGANLYGLAACCVVYGLGLLVTATRKK